jgi:hypothetical protein
MYIDEIYLENNGAIEQLSLVARKVNELPCPIIFVGPNGSGKTNTLSLVVDAIYEHAAQYYSDVAPTSGLNQRPFFRLVGGITVRAGKAGSVSIIKMIDANDVISYVEKAGQLTPEDARSRIPPSLHSFAQWQEHGSQKISPAPDGVSKRVFENGAYVYFPSSRAEVPYWMNENGDSQFDLTPKIDRRLNKPLVVEKGIHQLKQWLLSVLLDARVDVNLRATATGLAFEPIAVAFNVLRNKSVWDSVNQILRTILGVADARLVVFGRQSATVGFEVSRGQPGLRLDALSAGQATLLNIFGTLMRYGDGTTGEEPPVPARIEGICIVDEIDAHMHIDLQRRALPELIKMFPRVQFVLSSHSPFFLLGMKSLFPGLESQIIDMPTGVEINGEEFVEFDHAFAALAETRRFRNEVLQEAGKPGGLLVLVEGETDLPYLDTAIKLLEGAGLNGTIEVAWIGAKDKSTGEGFNTGKSSLHAAFMFLRANPSFIKRPVCFLFDNDAKKSDLDDGMLYVRSIPTISANDVITDGIENLLPQAVFTDEMFDRKEVSKGNGNRTNTVSLNKMRLCKDVCTRASKDEFSNFSIVIEIFQSLKKAIARL